jgi:hypothetical protein
MYTKEAFKNGVTSCVDLEVVEYLLNAIISLSGNHAPDKKGGFLGICYENQMVVCPFGEIPEDKYGPYLQDATEKITRLIETKATRLLLACGKEKRCGGGITCEGLTVAFSSGLSEECNEALSFVYANYILSHFPKIEDDGSYFWMSGQALDQILKEDYYPPNDLIFLLYMRFLDWANRKFQPGKDGRVRTANTIDLNMEATLSAYDSMIIQYFLDKYDDNVLLVARKLDMGKSTIYRMRQAGELRK